MLLLRIALLLPIRRLLLLLSAQSSEKSLYAITLLPALSAKESGQPTGERARIPGCRQQVVQSHLRELLHIWSDHRMIQISGNDDRNHQLAILVGECSVHEPADAGASNFLTQVFS